MHPAEIDAGGRWKRFMGIGVVECEENEVIGRYSRMANGEWISTLFPRRVGFSAELW